MKLLSLFIFLYSGLVLAASDCSEQVAVDIFNVTINVRPTTEGVGNIFDNPNYLVTFSLPALKDSKELIDIANGQCLDMNKLFVWVNTQIFALESKKHELEVTELYTNLLKFRIDLILINRAFCLNGLSDIEKQELFKKYYNDMEATQSGQKYSSIVTLKELDQKTKEELEGEVEQWLKAITLPLRKLGQFTNTQIRDLVPPDMCI